MPKCGARMLRAKTGFSAGLTTRCSGHTIGAKSDKPLGLPDGELKWGILALFKGREAKSWVRNVSALRAQRRRHRTVGAAVAAPYVVLTPPR